MAKEIKDFAASVKARLINLAKENREEVQSVLIRYGAERFLHPTGWNTRTTQARSGLL